GTLNKILLSVAPHSEAEANRIESEWFDRGSGGPNLGGLRILVVDDEADALLQARQCLGTGERDYKHYWEVQTSAIDLSLSQNASTFTRLRCRFSRRRVNSILHGL